MTTASASNTHAWLRSRVRRARWDISTVRRSLRRRGPRRWPWPPAAIAARERYVRQLGSVVADTPAAGSQVEVDVLSFSSAGHLPEQVASIRSFIGSAGAPRSWTVAGDGSHSPAQADLVCSIHPCVELARWDAVARPGLPQVVWDYARVDRMGKKLAALTGLPSDRPALYTDADILYFDGARRAAELMQPAGGGPRYMRDTALRQAGPLAGTYALDEALLRDSAEAAPEVNSGFLLIHGPLDWGPPLARLERRRWKPTTFTEQTVVHLAVAAAGGEPLDPERFLLTDADRGHDREAIATGADTVLRHYVSPVRYRFWLEIERREPKP